MSKFMAYLNRYAEMHSISLTGNNHELELYSPMWAALKAERDPLCRR